MSNRDFLPRTDAEFDAFFRQFHDATTREPDTFGLSSGDVQLVQTAYAAWIVAYPAHLDGQKKAHELTETKDKVREDAETAARVAARKINAHPGVDNEMRAKAALPSHELSRAAYGVPTTCPVARVESIGNHTLVLHVADARTPHKAAKPAGVHACEVCVFLGDRPPADPEQFTFLKHSTRESIADVHPAADAGKNAFYILRWVSTKLEPGPWSEVVSARVPV